MVAELQAGRKPDPKYGKIADQRSTHTNYLSAACRLPDVASLAQASAIGFEDVVGIMQGRCLMCHAAEPGWEGLHWPPKADVTHAMPPGNLKDMEPQERAATVEWFRRAGMQDPVQ